MRGEGDHGWGSLATRVLVQVWGGVHGESTLAAISTGSEEVNRLCQIGCRCIGLRKLWRDRDQRLSLDSTPPIVARARVFGHPSPRKPPTPLLHAVDTQTVIALG